ncbi:unnamed protein product [Choristocarpus tenellus]
MKAPHYSRHNSSTQLKDVLIDRFYAKEEFKLELQYGEISRDKIAPHHTFGMSVDRADNLKYIEMGKVLYTAGNTIVVLDLSTMTRRMVFGMDGRGVGCFAIHPSQKFIAVGEKGAAPNIYIYDYPSFRIMKVLRKGTELGYRALDFNGNGEKLASVGQAPDFMLTVWDWREERVILHCKAFGQDVTKVSFCPDDEGRLTTSGTGHIRFWHMATTFTGLKLQGEIGKFGKEDLSDIDAFCFLPDGKVVSGAENGSLLLWEGQFIKCVLARPGLLGCHDGAVMHVSLDRTDMLLVTSGADGFVRWWAFATVESADAEEDSTRFELEPVRELFLGQGITARCLERGGKRGDPTSDHFLVTDGTGGLWRAPLIINYTTLADPPAQRLMSFHAGAIVELDTSFLEHLVATAGADKTVRIWDYLTKRQLEVASFPRPATCLEWAHDRVDPNGQTVVVGFSDGVVRVLVRDHKAGVLRRAQTLKPHDGVVVAIAFSPCGNVLLTAGRDHKLFFIRAFLSDERKEYQPLGFHTLPSPPTSVSWSIDSLRVLVTCNGGGVGEVNLSGGHLDSSFEIQNLPIRWYTFKKRPPLHESGVDVEGDNGGGEREEGEQELGKGEAEEERTDEEEEEEEGEDLPTLDALKGIYVRGKKDCFLLAMGGWARGVIFECSWEEEYPLREIPAGYGPRATAASPQLPTITSLRYNNIHSTVKNSGPGPVELLISGCNDGAITLRPSRVMGAYARVQAHDGDAPVLSAACSYNGEWVVSGDADGILVTQRVCQELLEVGMWVG